MLRVGAPVPNVSAESHRFFAFFTRQNTREAILQLERRDGDGPREVLFFDGETYRAIVDRAEGGAPLAAIVPWGTFADPTLRRAWVVTDTGPELRNRDGETLMDAQVRPGRRTSPMVFGPDGAWLLFTEGDETRMWTPEMGSQRFLRDVNPSIQPLVRATFPTSLVTALGDWVDLTGRPVEVPGVDTHQILGPYLIDDDRVLRLEDRRVVEVARNFPLQSVFIMGGSSLGLVVRSPLSGRLNLIDPEGETLATYDPPEGPFETNLEDPVFSVYVERTQARVTDDHAVTLVKYRYEATNAFDRRGIGELVESWWVNPDGSARVTRLEAGRLTHVRLPSSTVDGRFAMWVRESGFFVADLKAGEVSKVVTEFTPADVRSTVYD